MSCLLELKTLSSLDLSIFDKYDEETDFKNWLMALKTTALVLVDFKAEIASLETQSIKIVSTRKALSSEMMTRPQPPRSDIYTIYMDRGGWGICMSRALQYLHEDLSPDLTVVHGNLKPESIGFSGEGHLKLYDFTLASLLTKRGSDMETSGVLVGKVGSLRYMAPEMYLMGPYTEKVDVYSFGIILWQLITCKKPFQGYTSDQLKSEVEVTTILCPCCYYVLPPSYTHPAVYHLSILLSILQVLSGGARPELSDRQFAMSDPLRELVTSCWASNPCDRPSFRTISEQLDILNDVHKKISRDPFGNL